MPEPVKMRNKPYWVCHSNGDVVASFDDPQSAEEDAKERCQRVDQMKLSCSYFVRKK